MDNSRGAPILANSVTASHQDRALNIASVPLASYRGWDPDKRRAAWELDRSEPGWAVFYGPYTRRFYAIAAWPSPRPLVLDA